MTPQVIMISSNRQTISLQKSGVDVATCFRPNSPVTHRDFFMSGRLSAGYNSVCLFENGKKCVIIAVHMWIAGQKNGYISIFVLRRTQIE